MSFQWFLFISVLCASVNADDFHVTLDIIRPRTSETTQTNAVLDLIKRIVFDRVSDFEVVVKHNVAIDGKDTFILLKDNEIVRITGSSGVAAAAGFHHYLKYYCNAHVSWEASQLHIPDDLPFVNTTIVSNDRFRYYQNVCTTSYSFVWWSWQDWERHIDWMALNAFNLALAFNGQEFIWAKVYENLGMTKSEINRHFTGPAFLSWYRMGNLMRWGGPLSEGWHYRSVALQQFILKRMRELGITPVLPAFAGHVPRRIKELYPNATIVKMHTWSRFNETFSGAYFVSPTDPFFRTIGKMFLKEQITYFGTDHIYNCDPFNEMTPEKNDLAYLSSVSRSIYESMIAVDPHAVWLLQGWMFYHDAIFWNMPQVEVFLTSIPKGRMIVLDLQSEQFPQYARLNSYFGQPFIWCMLHNFGGTLGMFGSPRIINNRPFQARNMVNSTMIGLGMTPEGINQNYILYDLMSEMTWRERPTDLKKWFVNYCIRRYGKEDRHAVVGWLILKDTVYNFDGDLLMRGKYVITKTPSLSIPVHFWYNTTSFVEAWSHFIRAADHLYDKETFRHDLVDVTRQALQIVGDLMYTELTNAFLNYDKTQFEIYANLYRRLFTDLDRILLSNKAFLLGKWLKAAKSAAMTVEDEVQFEYNARNQITLWGPNGEIRDYAIKQWSGVVSNYLGPRWEFFLDAMNQSLITRKPMRESVVRQEIFRNIEVPFTNDRSILPDEPKGDSIEIAKELYEYWSGKIISSSIINTYRRNLGKNSEYVPMSQMETMWKNLFVGTRAHPFKLFRKWTVAQNYTNLTKLAKQMFRRRSTNFLSKLGDTEVSRPKTLWPTKIIPKLRSHGPSKYLISI